MAVFSVNDADKYGGQGGGGFFRLVDDHDTARVRFLYNGIEDVQGYAVHQVEVGGKKRYVNCLRDYGSPKDVCPFCANGYFTTAKYFIPLYNVDEERTQIWEKGKQFGTKLSSLCSRYSNLVSHVFEIERLGKKGDTSTTYEVYEQSADDTILDDFEVPDILGSVILDKNADDMQYFIDYGEFPDDGGGNAEQPVRRRPQQSGGGAQRRTPANTRRNNDF